MAHIKKIYSAILDFSLSHIMIVVCAVFVVIGAILSNNFLTFKNITSIFRQMSIIGVLACGESVVIILGGIDASLSGNLCASLIIYALVENLPFPVAVIIVLLFASIFGLMNGLIVSKFKAAPFIITLGMGAIGEGIALLLSSGRPFFLKNHKDILSFIGTDYTLYIPNMVIVFLFIAIVGQLILSRTSLGLHWHSLGGNEEAAYWCGINTAKVKTLGFAFSGLMAGLAAILCVARTQVSDPVAGQGLSLEAMSAAVLGGTYMGGGGIGSVAGAILGAFILGMTNNLFNILNVSTYWQNIAKGIIIVVAIIAGSKAVLRKPRRGLK
jgi:ribose transport system permease protein